ncbi:hypothetical protein F2Q68_00030739 [Brassica cretica]|uniref:Uncharacterized protein n=2 Tax=Brassica cretica TaxID=69181 RepID=A0ABQ7B8U5_BRACR|nr:hypothetical protein F2Q68_00030739 [Brassica cretica]KAF3528596.1 hypothetical protein DY000_02039296 [Brassica cretica]
MTEKMEAMALATTNSLKELKNKKKRASLFTTTTHMKHIPHILDENLILRSEEQAKTVNVGVKIGYDGINAGKSLRNLSKRRIKNEKLDLRIFKTITRQAPRKGAIKPTSSDPPSGKLDKPRPIRPMASWIDQSNTPSGE